VRKVLAAWLLLVPALAFGDVQIPQTPAGETFAAWLTSFNSADPAQMQAFKDKHRRSGGVEDLMQFREATGGFELLRVEESKPDVLVALLRESATQRGLRFTLTRKGDGMGDNLIMEIRPAMLPPEFAVSRTSLADAIVAVTERADSHAKADKFSGVLLMARHGQVLLHRPWGLANRETRAPVTLDTQFRLGSMNKMFTAVSVLQLVEAGKLSLDAPVGRYLKDYPNRDVAAKVTVRHLLTHSGGTGDIFGPEFDAHRLQLQEHSDYVKLFGARAPQFQPGSEDRYSNYGYVLLGALIEAASGESYYDYVRTHIYEPAGMSATASLPESTPVAARAAGYMKVKGAWRPNIDTLPYRGMAAGGGYSTARDLLAFATALTSGKLLSKDMLAQATQPQDNNKGYGYGFGVTGEGALLLFGHGGGAPGMNGDLRIYPRLGYVLIGLSNLDPPAAENMVEHFAARMPVE
jgi:CubicO group peptidase (beta-lactamase class C family)